MDYWWSSSTTSSATQGSGQEAFAILDGDSCGFATDEEAVLNDAERRIEDMTARVSRIALPLQKGISSISRCFDTVRSGDPWRMTEEECVKIEKCIESCELPMHAVNDAVEVEHDLLLNNLVTCVNRCVALEDVSKGDEAAVACATRCIGTHLAEDELNDAVDRVAEKIQYLRRAKHGRWPAIPWQNDATCGPRFPGTADDLLASLKSAASQHKAEAMLHNEVKICRACGKACALTLDVCNSCSGDIKDTAKSYTDNVMMCFMLGVEKTSKYPLTIPIRAQSSSFLCYDDLLASSPCHLNVIPTEHYLPDWRWLLTRPREGLDIMESLYRVARDVAMSQFISNPDFVKKLFSPSVVNEIMRDPGYFIDTYGMSGFNYPPSQMQIHLQFIVIDELLPLMPFHARLLAEDKHFHFLRFFEYRYVRKVLQSLVDSSATVDLIGQFDAESVVDYIKDCTGVDYFTHHREMMSRFKHNNKIAANWRADDFEFAVISSGSSSTDASVISLRSGEEVPNKNAPAIQADDKLMLQNYGRPYSIMGAPTGTYYRSYKANCQSFCSHDSALLSGVFSTKLLVFQVCEAS
ncbi:hypothetical protein FOZ61_010317 [Perkinsus olseni]|uniref:Uncharacterized protein n=1 Tax=Perkinsus olseni TaxID=32597 RepID=A0A7J6KWX9_PEROL|nr:hypothetical protein FOZ61_010317 [Perkinsus olseni]